MNVLNENYKNKYLKYKNKYYNLTKNKKKQKGGNNTLLVTVPIVLTILSVLYYNKDKFNNLITTKSDSLPTLPKKSENETPSEFLLSIPDDVSGLDELLANNPENFRLLGTYIAETEIIIDINTGEADRTFTDFISSYSPGDIKEIPVEEKAEEKVEENEEKIEEKVEEKEETEDTKEETEDQKEKTEDKKEETEEDKKEKIEEDKKEEIEEDKKEETEEDKKEETEETKEETELKIKNTRKIINGQRIYKNTFLVTIWEELNKTFTEEESEIINRKNTGDLEVFVLTPEQRQKIYDATEDQMNEFVGNKDITEMQKVSNQLKALKNILYS